MNNKTLVNGLMMILMLFLGFLLGNYFGKNDYSSVLMPKSDNESLPYSERINGNVGSSNDENDGGTYVDPSMLSDSQITLLQTLGVDTDNIVITPEMIACAEAKIGAARMEEIKNGATPSLSEGASLVACYK